MESTHKVHGLPFFVAGSFEMDTRLTTKFAQVAKLLVYGEMYDYLDFQIWVTKGLDVWTGVLRLRAAFYH